MNETIPPAGFPVPPLPLSLHFQDMTVLFDPVYLEMYQADSNILRKENTVPLGNVILCYHLKQIIYELKVFFITYLRKKY